MATTNDVRPVPIDGGTVALGAGGLRRQVGATRPALLGWCMTDGTVGGGA